MPLTLTNACAVFQALINYMLWDILNQFVFVYLDTILIFSNNPEEQIAHLQHVSVSEQFFVKAENCEFRRNLKRIATPPKLTLWVTYSRTVGYQTCCGGAETSFGGSREATYSLDRL